MHVISGKPVAQLNMWRPRGPSLLQSITLALLRIKSRWLELVHDIHCIIARLLLLYYSCDYNQWTQDRCEGPLSLPNDTGLEHVIKLGTFLSKCPKHLA
jgi:hypothetical protein